MRATLWGDWAAKAMTIALVGGALVVVSLFLPWAQRRCIVGECPQLTVWEAAGVIPVIVVILAAAAIALAVLGVLGRLRAAAHLLILVGIASIVVVAAAPVANDAGLDFGSAFFLAMLGSIAVLAGGALNLGVRSASDEG